MSTIWVGPKIPRPPKTPKATAGIDSYAACLLVLPAAAPVDDQTPNVHESGPYASFDYASQVHLPCICTIGYPPEPESESQASQHRNRQIAGSADTPITDSQVNGMMLGSSGRMHNQFDFLGPVCPCSTKHIDVRQPTIPYPNLRRMPYTRIAQSG